MKRLGVVLVAAACGSSSPTQPDAPIAIDAPADSPIDTPPIDAPADSPGDAPAMPSGTHYHYVIDHVLWPATNAQARAYGFDLNGDGTIDNQLGSVAAALASQGMDVQAAQDLAVARGTSLMLADVQADDLTTASDAGFTLYQGTNPNPPPCNGAGDTVCGHHLTGTASFDVAAMPRDTPLVGPIASGHYTGGPGHLSVQLSIAGSAPVTTTLLGAHATLQPTATGITQGTIGGGIPATDIQTQVYPAMMTSFNAVVQRDCTALTSPPQCGCATSSTGATLISLFDTQTPDCSISLAEIENNSLVQSLFQPDVTIEGQQALSVGVAVTAVGATFTVN